MRRLYLLHFEPGYRHARHYLGIADDVAARVLEHVACGSKSSPLVRAAARSGSAILLARTWDDGTRTLERRLKRQGGLSRHCPLCRLGGAYHR